MKSFLSIFFFFLTGNILFGQSVITVAGQLNTAGATDGPAATADFNNPHGLAVDMEGTIYVADRYNHTIRKITRAGIVSTFAGKAGQIGDRDGRGENALFNEPWGIAVNEVGEILVADTKNNKIRKIEPDGTVTTIAGSGDFGADDGVALNATFGNPTGIESDKEGRIYIADHSTHVIRIIELDGTVNTIAGKANENGDADGQGENARFYRPYGLALDHQGNVLVADEWNHKIRKIDLDGNVTTLAGTGVLGHKNGLGTEAEFNYPWDITLDAEGNIYIGDGYNYVVRILSTDGRVKNFAGNLLTSGANDGFAYDARFSGVTSLDWSPIDNKIYLADAYNDLIRVVDEFIDEVTIVNASGQNEVCHGDTILLCSSLLLNNQWHKNGQPIEGAFSNKLKVTQSGIYTVTNYSCSGNTLYSNEIEAIVRPPLYLDFFADKVEARPFEEIIFTANRDDLAEYVWDFSTPSFAGVTDEFQVDQRFPENGLYDITLIGIDDFGCMEEVTKSSHIKIDEFLNRIFFPSGFTPNGDGVNDIFISRGALPEEYEIFIYDQWGAQVFNSKSAQEGWGGTFNNQPLPQGNYAYVASFFNGFEMETVSGVVSLLR